MPNLGLRLVLVMMTLLFKLDGQSFIIINITIFFLFVFAIQWSGPYEYWPWNKKWHRMPHIKGFWLNFGNKYPNRLIFATLKLIQRENQFAIIHQILKWQRTFLPIVVKAIHKWIRHGLMLAWLQVQQFLHNSHK